MNQYPLEWLDSLVLHIFNPIETHNKDFATTDLITISDNIIKESKKIQVCIKHQVFTIQKKRQIRLLVRKYHTTLVYLLDTTIESQKKAASKTPVLVQIATVLISNLEELLSFIEDRFSVYLSLDERVPITYLVVSKNELSYKLDALQVNHEKGVLNNELVALVIRKLYESVSSLNGDKITYRQILYQRELLKEIDLLLKLIDDKKPYGIVNELLVWMNFNCNEYINYFTSYIKEQLKSVEPWSEKRDVLLFYYKEFSQLASNEKASFDSSKYPVKYTLENWFRLEIAYLESKVIASPKLLSLASEASKAVADPSVTKVECELSSDQIGLILRATDEARIIKARSLSQVFKSIVPYLSTPFKKNLSYQSVRSKSYHPEERDKDIAINALEKIIKKIKTY